MNFFCWPDTNSGEGIKEYEKENFVTNEAMKAHYLL